MIRLPVVALVLGLAVMGSPAEARSGRDTVRMIQALGQQSGNEKVLEALRTLKSEGFLDGMGEALAGGEASDTAAVPAAAAAAAAVTAEPAPAAPGGDIGEAQAKQAAATGALPVIQKACPGAKAYPYSVKKTTSGGASIYRVTVFPDSMGVLMFFCAYTVDIDAASGRMLKCK